ncbi:PIG-L deacetylase family protein [Kitasatospora viridis]|uniref:LmbE family N-acetylglucosaminyl deacetylase n=1 Tax=Kitasatospora viridis TaxID=281105 RepID=A0A561T6X0_9ACTN|nr:PIG-L family deacetylase [Kitasatospora viridis]TWF82861.1 LmbE family N-acetylglucosaminyl deacetylase [Kitasatospora viridis]
MATLLAFHAHPDDEVLLTGGTLARAAAEGHRVVIVVATTSMDGEAGPDDSERLAELRTSAAVLGIGRVVHLGYADSGHGAELYPDPPGSVRFVRAETEEAAAKLAELIREEGAQVLLGYDANGGYGHRDHRKVHQVARRAAELVPGVRLLEATLPRERVKRLVSAVRALRIPLRYDHEELARSYAPRAAITHRIDVRGYARQKQAALAAHRSQLNGGGRIAPALRALTRLPLPVFAGLLGSEWYVEIPVERPAAEQ